VDPRLLGYLLHVDECVTDWSLPESPEDSVIDLAVLENPTGVAAKD
jgi:hypothetical protein